MFRLKSHKDLLKTSRLAGLLFACSTIAVHSQTTAVQLNNGDRISGIVISEDLNRVIISNAWAKEIVIPLTEIKSREKIPPPPPATNATVVAEAAPAPKSIVPTPAPKPVVKPKGARDWHGDIAVGADVGIS